MGNDLFSLDCSHSLKKLPQRKRVRDIESRRLPRLRTHNMEPSYSPELDHAFSSTMQTPSTNLSQTCDHANSPNAHPHHPALSHPMQSLPQNQHREFLGSIQELSDHNHEFDAVKFDSPLLEVDTLRVSHDLHICHRTLRLSTKRY
jgi:hypothetical protein